MRRLGLVVGFLVGCLGVSGAWGAPANPNPMEVFQPDGTKMLLTNRGDEFCFWVETPEGYSVIQNPQSGFWEYARKKILALELVPGGARVVASGKPPAGKAFRLRPLRFDGSGGSPVKGAPAVVRQPDGEELLLVPWNDGASSWWETPGGYAVAPNRRTEVWEYAQRQAVEVLEPSGHIYRPGFPAPPGMPLHEKPSMRSPY